MVRVFSSFIWEEWVSDLLWKAFIKRNTKSMRKLFRIILKDNPGDDKLRKIQPFRMIVNGEIVFVIGWKIFYHKLERIIV